MLKSLNGSAGERPVLEIKRSTAIANIRAIIHEMLKRVSDECGVIPEFLSAANDLDTLYIQFKSEGESVFDCLMTLDKSNDYVSGTSAEVGALIHVTKVVADQVTPNLPPRTIAADDCNDVNAMR